MSSPQRQVGSRRLPPLPQGSHTFVRVDNARGGATSNTPKIQNGTAVSSTAFPMGGKLPYDLSAAFMEGPFRPALQADSFSQFLAAAQMPSQELIPSGKNLKLAEPEVHEGISGILFSQCFLARKYSQFKLII